MRGGPVATVIVHRADHCGREESDENAVRQPVALRIASCEGVHLGLLVQVYVEGVRMS